MRSLGLEHEVVDAGAVAHAVARFRERAIALPTFAQLAEPRTIPDAVRSRVAGADPGAPDARNLFRVHWYNRADGAGLAEVPEHLVLPSTLTGVDAPVVILLGNRFPMVRAHKVLAAYACLAPRIVTGRFDPTWQRAVWPSTGNYARGGVAISRIMACRGTAVLPEDMSGARFRWLDAWVEDPADVIRTPGSESNVKEIYDRCAELEADPANVVFNQFCEFGNHLAHLLVTGRAFDAVFESVRGGRPEARLRAFVAATGSAGTLAAGDYLKERHGSLTVAVEPVECPTMLYNGFGQHNIQGIGDKHIPLIHNVTNTDIVAAVSDRSTDALDVLWNTPEGRAHLVGREGVPPALVESLGALGLSSICNVLASVKVAKHLGLGPDDVIMTVATDGAELYADERAARVAERWPGGLDGPTVAGIFAEHLRGVAPDHLLELTATDRNRIFNLGYYTWVEQQGVPLADFERRRRQGFWRALRDLPAAWDAMIAEFNARTGVLPG